MRVVWIVEDGSSGAVHQANVVNDHIDEVIPVLGKESDTPKHAFDDEPYIKSESNGMHYPTGDLEEAVRALDPDVCMFHILNDQTVQAITRISAFCTTVVRIGWNVNELGLISPDVLPACAPFIKQADHVVAASDAARRRTKCLGVPDENITTIPTAVSMADEDVVEPKRDIRHNICYLGRLYKAKSPHNAVLAMNALTEIAPTVPATMHFAGNGNLGEECRQLGESLCTGISRIKYHGYVDDITGLFDSCPIYVHPSVTENMPQAFLEAAQHGAACIAADAKWTEEIDSLVTYNYDDPYALAELLAEMCQNEAWRYQVAKSQQEEVMEGYSIQEISTTYMELFEELHEKYDKFKIEPEVIL